MRFFAALVLTLIGCTNAAAPTGGRDLASPDLASGASHDLADRGAADLTADPSADLAVGATGDLAVSASPDLGQPPADMTQPQGPPDLQPCGQSGQACCPGYSCTQADTTCRDVTGSGAGHPPCSGVGCTDLCINCGTLGGPCCTSGTACTIGVCINGACG